MPSTSSAVVSLGPLKVNLTCPSSVIPRMQQELEPFMRVQPGPLEEAALLNLELRPLAPPDSWRAQRDGEKVIVDTSLYRHLASEGLRFDVQHGYVVRIDLTQSYFFFEHLRRAVTLYQPDEILAVLDAIRALKSFFTLGLELAGGVQLHSAGVTLEDGSAVLLMGDMWQGKTTMLLELLSEFRVKQLSCDTVALLPEENALLVNGWPSPFSVSHGTLSDHPELASHFPEERRDLSYDALWREGKKTILTSQEVVTRFGTTLAPRAQELAHCIVVRFRPNQPTGIAPLTDPELLANELTTVYLGSRDPIYHNWHRYLESKGSLIDANVAAMSRRLLERCPVSVLTWGPSPVSYFKRIPALGRAHKHLGQLLRVF